MNLDFLRPALQAILAGAKKTPEVIGNTGEVIGSGVKNFPQILQPKLPRTPPFVPNDTALGGVNPPFNGLDFKGILSKQLKPQTDLPQIETLGGLAGTEDIFPKPESAASTMLGNLDIGKILRGGNPTATPPFVPSDDPFNDVAQVDDFESMKPPQSEPLRPKFRRPSQETQAQINDITDNDYSPAVYRDPATGKTSNKQKPGYVLIKERGRDRKPLGTWSTKDKLFSALVGALQGMGSAKGDSLTEVLGGGAAGGITAATDRDYISKQRDQANLQGLAPKLRRQQETEKADAEILNKELEAEGKRIGNAGKIISNQTDLLKLQRLFGEPYWEVVKNKKEITQADADALERLGYGKLPLSRWQQIKEMERNGGIYSRSEFSSEYELNPTVPVDPLKVPIGAKMKNPDGTEIIVPMLPKDAADLSYRSQKEKAETEAKKAEIERRQREREEGREEKTFHSVREWQIARQKAQQTIKNNQNIIAQIDASIAETQSQIDRYQGSYDVSELLKTKQTLEKQKAEYQAKIGDATVILNTPRPQVFKPKLAPKIKRSYSSADIQRVIRQ